MCSPVKCPQCQKTTWAGCGAHVQQVLGHLPKEQICRCREEAREEEGRRSASGSDRRSFLERFRSR